MATNIGNPAFRMALRRLLVCGAPGGCAPRPPPGGYAARGRHIFLSQNAPKKTLNF